MKYCDKCKVYVRGGREHCPLCQRLLYQSEDYKISADQQEDTKEKYDVEDDVFPYIPTIFQTHSMVFKVMNFLSIAMIVISIAMNLSINKHHWWSLFVIAAVVCFWISFYVAFTKRKNIPKNVLYQVVVISTITIVWDIMTGWNGWSVDFVVPILCISDMLVLYILSKILHNNVEDYMIYMLIGGLFGIVPTLFYICGWLTFVLPTILCVASSILFFSGVLIFQGEKIREELRRRLHY